MAQIERVKRRNPSVNVPWFATADSAGDRTLEQQLMGLDPLFAEVKGKSVLDVGCAEGLISLELAKAGAAFVHGVELRRPAVADAFAHLARLDEGGKLPVWFEVGNAQDYAPPRVYDVVIMLAVLHKLPDPSAAAKRLASVASDLVVVRLPPGEGPVIRDGRSGNRPHLIGEVLATSGFQIERAGNDGPFNEWVGYWRRVRG